MKTWESDGSGDFITYWQVSNLIAKTHLAAVWKIPSPQALSRTAIFAPSAHGPETVSLYFSIIPFLSSPSKQNTMTLFQECLVPGASVAACKKLLVEQGWKLHIQDILWQCLLTSGRSEDIGDRILNWLDLATQQHQLYNDHALPGPS